MKHFSIVASTLIVFGLSTIGVFSNERTPISPNQTPHKAAIQTKISLNGNAINSTMAIGDPVSFKSSLAKGADYIRRTQSDVTEDNAGNGSVDTDLEDGGWDWTITSFSHSANASAKNLYGVCALGMYYEYQRSSDAKLMVAMKDAADKMVADAEIRDASSLIFLLRFNDLSGVTGTAYKDAAKEKYDARLIAHGPTATIFAEYLRDNRGISQGYHNGIIGWDLGAWAIVADLLRARYSTMYLTDAAEIAEVAYKASFETNTNYFDLDRCDGWDPNYNNGDFYWYNLGVAGLIDAFNASKTHENEIPGLVAKLLASQVSTTGAICGSYGVHDGDEDWQSTAYVIMTLANLDPAKYDNEINRASHYLAETQDKVSGAWIYSDGIHYPEIGGENTSALFFASTHLFVTTDQNDVFKSVVYPHVGMGESLTAPFVWNPVTPDWTYKNIKEDFFIVPVGSQPIIAATMKVKWDANKATLTKIDQGTLFIGTFLYTQIAPGEVLINTANNAMNTTPAGQPLAKLTFTVLAPGYCPITIENVSVRYYDAANDIMETVNVTTHDGSLKMYLGDFASTTPASQVVGDGLINFDDLSPFAAAYWQQQPSLGYLSKFDIGPTNVNGSYFAFPKPDGKIEFEDLVIFAIGYGKSAAGSLPKKQSVPAVFALGEREASGNEMRVPVTVSGGVSDLRALSLVLKSSAAFVRVEKAGELDTPNGFVIAKQENGNICIDAAMIGAQNPAISKEGVIAYVVLQGSGSVALSEVKARDSRNNELTTNAMKDGVESIPASFAISQNYPNPFNPSTSFSYELPKESMVRIAVFNSLGQEVALLVNEVKNAGYYNVTWNAAAMPSGVYYYQVKASDVNVTKKMLLMK